jgi:hypothetical protein
MSLHISNEDPQMSIYFNRSSLKNVFDYLTICKREGNFHVVYKSDVIEASNTASGTTSTFTTQDTNVLLAYLSNCFALLVKDQIPYHSVDVLIPCFPSVRFGHAHLEEITPLILNCIRMWI